MKFYQDRINGFFLLLGRRLQVQVGARLQAVVFETKRVLQDELEK